MKGEEARFWHWELMQYLVLAKRAQAGEVGQEEGGRGPCPWC